MTKAREAKKTVQCVDTYSELYRDVFPEVRAYEAFKWVHLSFTISIYLAINICTQKNWLQSKVWWCS